MKRRDFLIIQVLLWMAVFFCMHTARAHAASVPATPAASQVQTVQSLEDTLFATHYDQDTMDARVGRLEETVFGQAQTNLPIGERISKLQSALSPGTLGPLSPQAKQAATTPPATNSGNATVGKPLSNIQQVQQAPAQQPMAQTTPAPGESDYPTVTQMEMKVFGKTFLKDDVSVRLTRLEKQVFKNEQRGELADRMDHLRLVVLGDTGAPSPQVASADPTYGGNYGQPQYQPLPQYNSQNYGAPRQYTQMPNGQNYGNPVIQGAPGGYVPQDPNAASYPPASPFPGQQNYSQPAYTGAPANNQVSPDMTAAMDEVEKNVLGHTYPAEAMTSRLDRVEMKVFHSTSPEMSTDDRLQRVIAVASAGGAPQSGRAKAANTALQLLPVVLPLLLMFL